VRVVPILMSLLLAAFVDEARAGAWALPRGVLWVKASGSLQSADEFYAQERAVLPDGTVVERGDARPFDENGRARVRQIWVEAEWGVSDRLTLGVQAPWKWLDFENDVLGVRSFGWGDLRSVARVAVLTGQTLLTVRSAVKWPTGRFSTSMDRLPIGENQLDLELGAQLGRSLGRPLSWVGAEGGRRFRRADDQFDFDPGDEWFWLVEAGHALVGSGRAGLKMLWQGTRGSDTSVNLLAPGTALGRDFDQLDAVLMLDLGAVFVEAGVGATLGSATYPTAAMWSLAVSRALAVGSPF
jgi:hypothetical protein